MRKLNKINRYVAPLQVPERPLSRNTQGKQSGLYLLELRSHHISSQSPVPRRKIVVTIQAKGQVEGLPRPVKITHS